MTGSSRSASRSPRSPSSPPPPCPARLDPAFRGRFSYVASLDYYTPLALSTIIERAAAKQGLVLVEDAALTLGERSRGTPRTALHLLAQAADYAVVMSDDGTVEIDSATVLDSLALHDIDHLGLTRDDRRFLQTLCVDHMGGPVGLANLANSIGVDMPTVVGMIEPFLIRAGLIKRGPRGRMATTAAYEHLGLKPPVTLAWQD